MAGLKYLTAILGLGAFIATEGARAETSPLSIKPEGFGLEINSFTARERAMGEAGMASITKQGLSIPNPSRTAFHDKTSFTATFDTDVDYLQDNATSNRTSSFVLPSLGLNFSLRKYGNLGFYYRQRFERNYSYSPLDPSRPDVLQSFSAEGGVYEVATTYALSPIPSLAFSLGYHFLLGRERLIKPVTFNQFPDSANLYNGENLSDTVSTRSQGGYPSASVTYRNRLFSLAASGALGVSLDQTITHGLTGMINDDKRTADKDLPWSLAVGGAYKLKANQTLVADFSYEPWDESASPLLNPAIHTGLGYEYLGTGGPYEPYYRKIAYRGGLGFERLYLEETDQYFLTAGSGLPLGKRGNILDLAIKYGHRGTLKNNLWTEDLIKISVSLTGVGVWGQPVRKRR
jgi:hypothetical protein